MTAGKLDEKKGEIQVPTNGYVERYNRELKATRLHAFQPSAPVQFLQRHFPLIDALYNAVEVNGQRYKTQQKKKPMKVTVAHYEKPIP